MINPHVFSAAMPEQAPADALRWAANGEAAPKPGIMILQWYPWVSYIFDRHNHLRKQQMATVVCLISSHNPVLKTDNWGCYWHYISL